MAKGKKDKKKETRVERYFRQHPNAKEVFYVNDEIIFTNTKAAEKSGLEYKTITRNG